MGAIKARQLALQYGIPLVSVHHMEAHALVARLPNTAEATAAPVVRMAATIATTPTAMSVAVVAPDVGTHGSAQLDAVQSPPSHQQELQPHFSLQNSSNDTAAVMAVYSSDLTAPLAGVSSRDVDAAALLADIDATAAVPFPFVCLLVSGGHNLLVLVREVGNYVELGTTADDALGELGSIIGC